ncbi:MAG: InlB B-repeat-containing protein [Ruminococcus sp.]|nr:InlB B-repeat-containing protein [Ruminococcus sp.]
MTRTLKPPLMRIAAFITVFALSFEFFGFLPEGAVGVSAVGETYTIHYNVNGRTGSIPDEVVTMDTVGINPDFSNFKFENGDKALYYWDIKPDEYTYPIENTKRVRGLVNFETIYNIVKEEVDPNVGNEITLYAHWDEGVTVTFDANDKTGNTKSMIAPKNYYFDLPSDVFTPPTDTSFTYWCSKPNIGDTGYKVYQGQVKIADDITLYAINEYYINIYKEPTDDTPADRFGRYYNHGRYAFTDAVITDTSVKLAKDGYKLNDKYKDRDTGKEWTNEELKTTLIDDIGREMHPTALYSSNNYNIVYDANGGSLSGDYTSGEVYYGAEIVEPKAAKDGYIFKGWDSDVSLKMPAKAVTYKARWQAKSGERIPGDANDDGEIDIDDVLIIQQYIAKWGVTINLSNANVNGDDAVNIDDVLLIQQYIAKWGVTLQ